MIDRRVCLALFFLGASVLALILAFIMEYGFGILSCKLCSYQRLAYCFSILFSIVFIVKAKNIILSILVASYFMNMFIASYQVMVENGLVENIVSCTSQKSLIDLTDQEIFNITMHSPEVACNVPHMIIGLSVAGWNVVYCAIVISLFLYFRTKYEDTID